MNQTNQRESLSHPAFGKIPARRILECIFALAPDSPILHWHLEEMNTAEENGDILYTLNGQPPAAGRERCRVIPPLVREF